MKKVVLTLALLSMASLASADPIVHLEALPLGSPADYPNLQVYHVYLVAEPGYLVQGFDGHFLGSMWQEWVPMFDLETATLDNVDMLEMVSPGAGARDTHLMWYDDELFIPAAPPPPQGSGKSLAPHEQQPVPSPSGVGTWFGNTSTVPMSFVFLGTLSDNTLLAQIVIPTGGEVLVVGNAGYKWGSPAQYAQNEVELLIPEPATLGLLTLGAAVAVLRRRR